MSKFASLTPALLARKGEAVPTSSPFADQMLTRIGAPAADIQALTPMHGVVPVARRAQALPSVSGGATGAWGRRPPVEALRPVRGPEPAPQVAEPPPFFPGDDEDGSDTAAPVAAGTVPDTKTFHVNLRLKRGRFVRLKLSAALLRRPVQDIVGEALDQWFDRLPPDVVGDCACLRQSPCCGSCPGNS